MRVLAIFILALVFFSAAAIADFVMTQEEEQVHPGGTNKATITIKVKGQKVRMDRTFPPVSTIVDHASQKTITLFHPTKVYNEVTASQQKESLESVVDSLKASGRMPTERPKIHATGKTQTISGWNAEEYVAETKSMKATYWLAKDLSAIGEQYRKATYDPMMAPVMQQFPDPDSFPPGLLVLMVLEQETPVGKIKTTQKTISVKEGPLSDEEFSVPKGYKHQ